MGSTHVIRFVVFGVAGFAIGWSITAILLVTGTFRPWAFFVGGMCGGAALGIACWDWKRAAVLTLAGALGCGVGFHISLLAADFIFWLSIAPRSMLRVMLVGFLMFLFTGPVVGMFGGAALGLTFGNWKRTVVLTLVGLVGFSVGEEIAAVFQPHLFGSFLYSQLALSQGPPLWVHALDQAIRGAIGGASLGAALGYLQQRELVGG
jgi:hypothetical protein